MEATRIIELAPTEKSKLIKKILGYGKLKEAAEKTGLHINTIKIISIKGSGTPKAIKAIRENLFEDYTEGMLK